MSTIASDKEAHPVCITMLLPTTNRLLNRNKLASIPHRVLARMDLYYRKENAIRFKKTRRLRATSFPYIR